MNPTSTDPPVDTCPSEDELSAFGSGDLPSVKLDSIAEHLATCARCESVVAAQGNAFGGLADELRRLASEEIVAEDVALAGEMALVESKEPRFADETSAAGWLDLEPAVPGQVRDYQLLEKLGRGGMGTVYKAVHSRLGKLVAIKLVSPDRVGDPEAVARFRREMKAVGLLNHPHIVGATDAGEVNGTHFLVMEFIEGIDLARLVRRLGPLPVAVACELIRQAADGLHHAHSQGLVHRDVKPSNLLLAAGGQVKVLDFGLALLYGTDSAGEATASSTVLGSCDYMAPEQGDDPHAVDARADLYSLGATLYYLLAAAPPFPPPQYRTPFQKMSAHARVPPPPISELRAGVPDKLAVIVRRLLAKKATDRFATAAEVAQALEPFANKCDLIAVLNQGEEHHETALDDPVHTSKVRTAAVGPGEPGVHVPLARAKLRLIVIAGCLFAAGIASAIICFTPGRGAPEQSNHPAIENAKSPPVEMSPKTVMRGHAGPVRFMAFAPNGTTLASASDDKSVRLWDLSTGTVRQTLPLHDHTVYCAVFSPDGRILASADTAPKGGDIRLWDVEAGRPAGVLKGHTKGLFELAFSADGKWLASAGLDKTVRVWEMAMRTERHVFDDSRQPSFVRRLAFFPDSKTLASAGGRVSIWDLGTGTQKTSFEHGGTASMRVAPDGEVIAAAKWQSGTITLFDPATGHPIRTWRAHESRINDLAFNPKSGVLASTGSDGTARLWDISEPRELAVLKGHSGDVYPVAFSPDGQTLATGGASDHAILLWDVSAFAAPPGGR